MWCAVKTSLMLIGLHFRLVVLSSCIAGKGVKGLCVSLMKLCLSSKMFMVKTDLARRHLRRVLVLKYLMSLVFFSRKMFANLYPLDSSKVSSTVLESFAGAVTFTEGQPFHWCSWSPVVRGSNPAWCMGFFTWLKHQNPT